MKLPDKIKIPRLQRDYVQGAKASVIIPFVNQLLGDKPVDLNYIYGLETEDGFEPVDGQQRLTTFWLLRLCLSKIVDRPFDETLSYYAREYADNFCRHLMDTTDWMEVMNPRQAKWYLRAWDDDLSVSSMVKTIETIKSTAPLKEAIEQVDEKQKLYDALKREFDKKQAEHEWLKREVENAKEDCKEAANKLSEVAKEALDSLERRLSYSILPLEEGVNEDIYIKMNRRGVQLTDFENLKSWLDEKAAEQEIPGWQIKMDGDWADMAWSLLVKPDAAGNDGLSVDDLMLSCLYAFAQIYWSIQGQDAFDANVNADAADVRSALFIEDEASIYGNIMERLNESKDKSPFELYQLDKLPIFNKGSMEFIMERMDRLAGRYKSLNNSDVYFVKLEGKQSIATYLLLENTYRSRAILYAVTANFDSKYDGFDEWLRRIRNLLLNSEVSYNNFAQICKGIDQLCGYTKECPLNEVFINVVGDGQSSGKYQLHGFNRVQIEEETQKSSLADEVACIVRQLENHPFFTGKVHFLFDFCGNNPTLEDVQPYAHYMTKLFGDSSFKKELASHLRQSMLSFGWYGYWNGCNWDLLGTRENIKRFICDNSQNENRYHRPDAHNAVLKMLIDELYRKQGLVEVTPEILHEISSHNYQSIPPDDPRRYFDYIESWKYMGNCQLRKGEDTEMTLLSKKKMSAPHIDLWVHRLYVDWKKAKKNEDALPDGKFGLYERECTCVYLDKKFEHNENGTGVKTVTIDIMHAEGEYDKFKLAVFVREDATLTKELFQPLAEGEEELRYKWVDEDRFVSCSDYSRDDLIPEICRVHGYIRKFNQK